MEIKSYESKILEEINKVFNNIINTNKDINISAKKGERIGDGISKYLEEKFVEYTENNEFFVESKSSPKGKTKNPFDIQTGFKLKQFKDLLWLDIKSINIENEDSNPDCGTPNKILKFIKNGNFYLIYVIVYYKGTTNGSEFVSYNDKYVESYLLKDINPSMHITPANQIQVNRFSSPVYRTRDEFIDLLIKKITKSNERKLKKASHELENLKNGILKIKTSNEEEITINSLKENNKNQEYIIKNL